MHRKSAKALATTAIILSLGAVAAPIASADSASDTTAKPIAICITIPLPGSADWVWCF
ncbi:hypothetical protein J2W56_001300 [Nocardia kruczakiae]|jgi:hypothetical protein|uniref:ABC transporter substrate-binding protein n=1 Tax=Nocardia kruczakiae TaxID=261477 RepID=A0ABU1XAM7_9NOCA|nr:MULTISPECIES: hypothetical protein [Nocardia]MDR7167581.1 hypothetical protein [Nocardia kruczakiae]